MKKILFYGQSPELESLRQIAEVEGILTIAFGDESLEHTLATVFTYEKDIATTNLVFPHEYMIMEDISTDLMSQLLKQLDAKGMEFEGIKVMRTETNQAWQLYDLLQETSVEHATMKKAVLLETVI